MGLESLQFPPKKGIWNLCLNFFIGEAVEVHQDLIANEIIESEHEVTDYIPKENEFSHVEEIVDEHDYKEVTISYEEEVPDIMDQVQCAADEYSDVKDDN